MSGFLLVTNPGAGSADPSSVDAARTVLAAAGPVSVASTGTLADLGAALAGAAGRTVVVAGGDGSLHAVVNELHSQRLLGSVTLGLVPLGTGNDFARGAGIPLDPAAAARLVVSTDPRPMDLVVDDNGSVTVNNVHLGVGAQAARAGAALKHRLGRLGYAAGAAAAAVRPSLVQVTVTVDDRVVHTGKVMQVAVGNNAFVGGGTELVPGADPTSGRLTVIVSAANGPAARAAYAARLRRGSHHRMREVLRVQGSVVSVTGEPFSLSSDGELSGPVTAASWRVLPGAVAFHLP